MTTQTMRQNRGNGGLLEFMIVLLILAACLVFASLALPKVKWTAHASLHAESAAIQQCFDPGNVLQIWINSSGERHNCLVKLPDGKVGDAVLQYSCRKLEWIGVAAYFIGDAELSTAVKVLKAKACIQVYP